VSGVGLLVATEIEEGSLLHLEFALPDLDGGILTVTLAVAVQSVRSDPVGRMANRRFNH